MFNRATYRFLVIVALLLIAASLAGCTVVGIVADKMSGAPKVPAQYVPEKDVMLVLVESYRNPSSVSIASEQLDRQIVDELVQNRVAPMVNPDRLSVVRHQNAQKFEQLDIAAMGRSFGATQVLYVDVQDLDIEPALGSEMLKGRANARVKIVDAATGRTRWPVESRGGYPVTFQSPYIALKDGVNEGAVRERLVRELADRVAKLFYTWTQEESEPNGELAFGN